MATTTSIEWTDRTWNPITGCTKISAGCDNCYAATFAERFRGVSNHPYKQGFDLKLWPDRVGKPLAWPKPSTVFVNSMSDLHQKGIPDTFVDRVYDTMERADRHVFQVLTKRSSLQRDYVAKRYSSKPVPPHIWLGTSVENKQATSRIRHLRDTNASVRFLSIEPLLEDIGHLDLTGIHWVIVGGESGAKARPMKPEWARHVRDACIAQGVPFFFKQWGTFGADGIRRSKARNGRLLDGRTWDETPEVERVVPDGMAA